MATGRPHIAGPRAINSDELSRYLVARKKLEQALNDAVFAVNGDEQCETMVLSLEAAAQFWRTAADLWGGIMTSPKDKTKEQCDVCGGMYGIKYLTTHRRKEHGIRGGRTGIIRRTPAEMNGKKKPPTRSRFGQATVIEDPNRLFDDADVEVITKAAPLSFHEAPFVVLEDSEGGIWLAERIR